MTIFGDFVKNVRKKSGLTQAQLANELGLYRSIIGMTELGIRIPTKEQFLKLIKFFGIPESDIKEIIQDEIIDQLETISAYDLLKLLSNIE